jgi:glutaredoxin
MKIDFKKYIVPAICVLVVVAAAFGLYYLNESKAKIIKPQAAADKVINYINEKYLKGQAAAVLGSVTEDSGVYKIQFKIQEQEYVSYVTKDGKVLFPAGEAMIEETSNPTANTGSDIPKKDTAQALLFVMSFCPYGNQAEELMMSVNDLLKNKADIQLRYVIYSNYNGGGPNYCLDKDNKYCSMHGIQELNQDVREICVEKYQPDKFWSFVKAINAKCTAQNVDSCWEAVAQSAGVDVAKVKTCQKNEALTLLEQEVQLGKKYGISGSPQLVINDKEFTGSRGADAFKTAICSGFNSVPSECSTQLQDSGAAPATGGCE